MVKAKSTSIWMGILAGMILGGVAAFPSPARSQAYSVPAALQAKIDSHPHVRRLTDWGGRPDWSADGKRLLFVSREYGDVFELDTATGKTRPMTFHFSHDGIFRAHYLHNGDLVLTAPREHTPGMDKHGRFFESELWLLTSDLSGPPVPFGERNVEGIAVARNSMKIAWATPPSPTPPRGATDKLMASPQATGANSGARIKANQIWMADAVVANAPTLANKRLLLDCGDPSGAFAHLLERENRRCVSLEPQNFVPKNEDRLTFHMVATDARAPGPLQLTSYVLDLNTNQIESLNKGSSSFVEAEGVFPDGMSTLIEYFPKAAMNEATPNVDLWRTALDGSGKRERVTHYNAIDPELKSNQGVVSPDGRWMVFGVSTRAIEEKVLGQGIGLFLMDLRAAGIR